MELKTQVVSYYGPNHGSSTGELKTWIEYYNPVTGNWESNRQKVMIDIKMQKYKRKLYGNSRAV